VLDPPDAKGLEFDAVVVVEPAAIAAGTARGLRLLYVALTRAVQELVVVHHLPLPPGLDLDLN
jgi:DNA helicase IV